MRMTKARKAIMETLARAKAPLSAQAVYEALKVSADPATVYRNLHALEDEGLADSFILHCAGHGTERYYTALTRPGEGGEDAHRHWFHCEKCHRFTDLGSCKLAPLVADFEASHGLTVRAHSLYLTGICARCK